MSMMVFDFRTRWLTVVRVFVAVLICGLDARTVVYSQDSESQLNQSEHVHNNSLIGETSPYLLQHAHNPVNWYPWGKQAFELAQQQGKPIFLSIGYSTCYWCHVMERESFEREDVAAILNQHYIAIKVDREERPELDQQFMVATQLVSRGRGGWPNSLWLTPEGKPWMAGTYFPREQFKSALLQLADAWKTKHDVVLNQADSITAAIETSVNSEAVSKPVTLGLVRSAVDTATKRFDTQLGGFGAAPKFPPHDMLAVLIDQYQRVPDPAVLKMIDTTLRKMACGGVCDQLGGGFHRYSTDNKWLLPHFEKMLYDNAQLMRSYTDGYLLTNDGLYRETVEGIYQWLEREMTSPNGGFYSAIDSESDAEEGKYYVWSHAEILKVLGDEDGGLFAKLYGINVGGNFHDEATGEPSVNNIPHRKGAINGDAKAIKIGIDELNQKLAAMRAKLLLVRSKREYPHLDDKVIAAWNGLMVEGLAYAGRRLDEPKYVAAAKRAADFLLESMFNDERLMRTSRAGQTKLDGYLNDYAFVAKGLLEVHRAIQEQGVDEQKYLNAAESMVQTLLDRFQDPVNGGFFFTADETTGGTSADQLAGFVIRSKNLSSGGNIPSGNGVAAEVLLELAELKNAGRYREAAQKTLDSLAGHLHQYSGSPDHLLLALSALQDGAVIGSFGGSVFQGNILPAKLVLKPGQTIVAQMNLSIDAGWHLYAKQSEFSRVTELKIGDDSRIKVVSVKTPPGTLKSDPVLNQKLSIYENKVTFDIQLQASKDATPGEFALDASLNAQACDNTKCIAPESVPFCIPVTIVGN